MARLSADCGCVGTIGRLVHLGHLPAQWPSCGVLSLRVWTSRCIEVTGEVASSPSSGGALMLDIDMYPLTSLVCERPVSDAIKCSKSSLRLICDRCVDLKESEVAGLKQLRN